MKRGLVIDPWARKTAGLAGSGQNCDAGCAGLSCTVWGDSPPALLALRPSSHVTPVKGHPEGCGKAPRSPGSILPQGDRIESLRKLKVRRANSGIWSTRCAQNCPQKEERCLCQDGAMGGPRHKGHARWGHTE